MDERLEGVSADETDSVVLFLRGVGADRLGHSQGRTLLDHLVETRKIVARWLQPPWVQDAAALHSVYGTDHYRGQLLTVSDRDHVRAVAGRRAERLAYLFGAVERRALFAWLEASNEWPQVGTSFAVRWPGEASREALTRREAGELLVLHMANLAEQACGCDGLPGPWVAQVSRWASRLVGSDLTAPPIFGGCISVINSDAEQSALSSYLAGLSTLAAPRVAAAHFATASQRCPWVGEPWLWRAWLALALGRNGDARLFAGEARRCFVELGTCWDKRLSFDRWLLLTVATDQGAQQGFGGHLPVIDMRRLSESFDALNAGQSKLEIIRCLIGELSGFAARRTPA